MKIPKIFHYVWVGPYPDSCDYVNSWCDTQPESVLLKWTNNNPLTKEYIDECIFLFGGIETLSNKGMTYISDLFRLLILRDYGGIYIDHDFILLKNFSNLLIGKSLALTFQYDPSNYTKLISHKKGSTMSQIVEQGYDKFEYRKETVNNCFIAVTPNHPLILKAIKLTVNNHFLHQSQQYPMSDWGVGPSVMTQIISELGLDTSKSLTVSNNDVIVYERNFFHPLHGLERHQIGKDNYERKIEKLINDKNAYAIHVHEHFGASLFIDKKLILFPEWYESQYN